MIPVNPDGSIVLTMLALLVFISLVSLVYGALRSVPLPEEEDNGRAARALSHAAARQERLLLTHRVVLALALMLLAAMLLALLGSEATALARMAVLALGGLVLIFVEYASERLGASHRMTLIRIARPAFGLLMTLLTPVTWLLSRLTALLLRVFGGQEDVVEITEDAIRTLVQSGHSDGTIEQDEKDMIFSVLQMDRTWARELMVPRMDIVALEADRTLGDALQTFIDSGYSRIPIYEETIDNVIGVLYAKDLLPRFVNQSQLFSEPIRAIMRQAYFVPESKPADELLGELRERNVHIAIVVDEYGGTSGLVTIEDMVEEIVGDIRDEYDQEEAEYVAISDNVYEMDASMDLDDVNHLLGTSLDSTGADTIGGLIFLVLGRVPDEGEVIDHAPLRLEVLSLDGRRIRKVRVTRDEPGEAHVTEANSPDNGNGETRGRS
jgi:putative hemolysin